MERRSLLRIFLPLLPLVQPPNSEADAPSRLKRLQGVVKTMGNGGPLAQARDAARRGMPPLTITDVKIIATAPSGSNWTIVKVETSEPGLYGPGRRDPPGDSTGGAGLH